ncbi:MAG: phytanoyl-CoA dioxygenase family protein [Pseudomonadota bacterium]|nr:phytanoyl-CoA dioxygenase family protein [Pseudomonadota bacterium]MDE3038189.1 phytanoyl-CoA dioxygenase family protein [Pseudomonadota bacterium]
MPQRLIAGLSRLKRYFRDRRALYYYLNKAVRSPRLRRALHLLVRSVTPRADAAAAAQEDTARLRKDGIIIRERLLDASTVDKIRRYLLAKPVYNLLEEYAEKGKTPLRLDEVAITRQTKLKYFDADIAGCREIVDLANSPEILSLVSAYLGCKPTIANMAAWWTKAGNGSPEKFYDDMFHRDVDDYKFLKLFVYLNDVAAGNGAHCFVRGSHISGKLTARRTFTDEEIDQNFDKSDRLVLTGKSGCGFLEDTWGLHRSMPCVEGERLVLHFLYSLTSLNAQTTPKPVAKNTYGVDAYTNRVYLYP